MVGRPETINPHPSATHRRTVPQFLVSPEDIDGTSFHLSGDEARHLLQVHRARSGDAVRLFDGRGRRFAARIDSVEGRAVRGTVLEELPEAPPPRRLTLHLSLLPRARFELALEQGTELGVAAFQPVAAARDTARLGDPARRRERWRRVLLASSKQCLRARLPELLEPAPLAAALAAAAGAARLLAWEGERRTALEELLPPAGAAVHLFVGPEGGFSEAEVAAARAAGARTFTLGPSVLRSETAALAAAARILR